jgi:hypothetical protein
MKKLVLLTVLVIATQASRAQGGRIKVYFAGFDCIRETWDDILQSDGKGDEVFFNFSFLMADRNGNAKLSYEKRTPVYGDATGPFSNRVSVGSCVDLFGGARGGIKGGDTYRCNDLIGEYNIADGDVLAIMPTGWEFDPIADNSASFFSTLKGTYDAVARTIGPVGIVLNLAAGNLGGVIQSGIALGIAHIPAGGDQGELGKAGTRPLGMLKYGGFSPEVVRVNTAVLPTLVSNNLGYGPGVIAVKYDEVANGNLRDHGIYVILLRLEYTASAAPPPPPPPSSNPTTAPASVPKSTTFVKQTSPATGISAPPPPPSSASAAAGNWTGTWGNGESTGPNYYSFRLGSDGSMDLLDAGGTVIARGTYTVSGTAVSGSYTYTNNNAMFSWAATISGTQMIPGGADAIRAVVAVGC